MRALDFVLLPPAQWPHLDPLDQKRAAMFWAFNGGENGDTTVDALLTSNDFGRYEVRDEQGAVVAAWWQLYDAGLLFAPGSAQPLGEAIQHGFVCRDVELWRELARTDSAPGPISWGVEEEDADGESAEEGPILWQNAPAPDDALRALLAARALRSATRPPSLVARLPRRPTPRRARLGEGPSAVRGLPSCG
jgi:hypothetical protein